MSEWTIEDRSERSRPSFDVLIDGRSAATDIVDLVAVKDFISRDVRFDDDDSCVLVHADGRRQPIEIPVAYRRRSRIRRTRRRGRR